MTVNIRNTFDRDKEVIKNFPYVKGILNKILFLFLFE